MVWPEVGCGPRFFPDKKGASLEVELTSKSGTWGALLSQRIPPKLDNRIKEHYATLYQAAKYLNADDLRDELRSSSPRSTTSTAATWSPNILSTSGSTAAQHISRLRGGAAWR